MGFSPREHGLRGESWAAREVCEARLLAAGEETRDEVLGFFASAELQECHDEQKAEVERLTANGVGR